VRKIARGGFSSVYEVQHKVDQQKYAVKKTVLRTRTQNAAKAREELMRLLKEVRLLAVVIDPHIVRYNHSWLEVTEDSSHLASASAPASAVIPEVVLESPYIEFASAPQIEEPSTPKGAPGSTEMGARNGFGAASG
jgi:serine/threonine protein kinase